MKCFSERISWLLLFLTTPLLAGCNGKYSDEPQRRIVQGYVSYGGETVNEGTIRFVPIGENGGPTSGGHIKLGYYKIDLKGGVPLGEHRVEVEAFRLIDKNKNVDAVDPDPPKEQYIPAKWNRNSELSINVESSNEPLESNIELDE
ncbi:hypothetical protein [Rubinisphaera sp. JC750]|uniref:hypothetical protein n=1 Tax=Rubinisphaera sp. JC750 TaxID=2898658 RepID=UPI001F1FEFC8|nr:hypothetical protein [Rubinisphaera sp. JC750]